MAGGQVGKSQYDSCTATQGERAELAPGQSATRAIDPRAHRNFTGIVLHRDAIYSFTTEGIWKDGPSRWPRPGSAKGFIFGGLPSAFFMTLGAPVKRKRWARWMEMIGEVPAGSRHLFRIGERKDDWPSDRDGELAVFANDFNAKWAYRNNRGCVRLTVRRIR
jgi:hypothetical protein